MRSTVLKLAAGAAPLALAVTPLLATPAQAAPTVGSATITPATHLVDSRTVSVSAPGFTGGETVFATQCATSVIQNNPAACDTTTGRIVQATTDDNGTATFTFVVHTGKNFHHGADDTFASGDKCDPNDACLIAVADGVGANATHADFGSLSFGAVTTTRAHASHKLVKRHHKVTIAVRITGRTHHLPITGKVVFRDNGKKFAVKKVASTGRESVTRKLSRLGKHVIKATYTGDANYQTSTGKVRVKVKK